MDFTTLSQYPVTFTYEVKDPSGKVVDSCEVTCDANKFSGDLDRHFGRFHADRIREFDALWKLRRASVSNGQKPKGKRKSTDLLKMADEIEQDGEREARLKDLHRETVAEILASDRYGVLMRWGAENVKRDDEGREVSRGPIPPTFENLMQVPGERLEDLLRSCREAARPKERPATTRGGRKAGRQSGTTSSTSSSTEAEKSTTQQLDGPPN